MDLGLAAAVFALGLGGGFLSGLLGIGGGVVIFPLLLMAPPALALAALSVKSAAAITAVQSFFGALSGALGHHRRGRIDYALVRWFGGAMAVSALAGSLASRWIADDWIVWLFSAMAVIAAYLMLRSASTVEAEQDDPIQADFDRSLALVTGLVLGGLAGLVGQGGAFLFIPVLLHVLKIPLRITIGSALVIGLLSSTAVLAGRMGTQQVPYLLALCAVAGAVLGGQWGSALSHRAPRQLLRRALSLIIVGTAVHMTWSALAR